MLAHLKNEPAPGIILQSHLFLSFLHHPSKISSISAEEPFQILTSSGSYFALQGFHFADELFKELKTECHYLLLLRSGNKMTIKSALRLCSDFQCPRNPALHELAPLVSTLSCEIEAGGSISWAQLLSSSRVLLLWAAAWHPYIAAAAAGILPTWTQGRPLFNSSILPTMLPHIIDGLRNMKALV